MHTLKELVVEHFPLLKDRFNFQLGRPKYFIIEDNNVKQYCYPELRIDPNNRFAYKIIIFPFYTLDDYKFVLIDMLKRTVFKEQNINTRHKKYKMFMEIVDIVYANTLSTAQEKITRRENKIVELCENEYVRYRSGNKFTKLIDYKKNKVMGIRFVKNENKYKYCSINSTNGKVINMKSWKSILHEINTIYILNVKQGFFVEKQLMRAVCYNKFGKHSDLIELVEKATNGQL